MFKSGNTKVAIAMSLGMVFGGYLALDDRAQRLESSGLTSGVSSGVVINLPDPESELQPPLLTRNHWQDREASNASG